MIYLILAILSSTIISLLMRVSEKYIKNNMTMFFWNYCICFAMAVIYNGGITVDWQNEGITFAVFIGAISGILYLVNFVLLQCNIRKNGVVLSGTFMKLGVIVPVLMALLVFHEKPGILQAVGCILAIIAILLVQLEKEGITRNTSKILLVILLLVSGFTDSLANVFEKFGNGELKDLYLLLTFFAAAGSAYVMKIQKKQKTGRYDVLFGLAIGIPNYFSARFLLLSLGSLPAIVVYPGYSVATIICITAAGLMLFRERLTKQKAAAMVLILASLFCINY